MSKVTIGMLLLGAAVIGCGGDGVASGAEYRYAHLFRYPVDDLGVACYYYDDVSGSLSCVKVR